MTEVDFYTHASQPFDVAAKLCAKAYQRDMRVRVLTNNAQETIELDHWLWHSPALSFLPHCQSSHRLASETPIIIGETLEHVGPAELLINLTEQPPPFFARFLRLMEIIGLDERCLVQGRVRYRYYRDRGYSIRTHRLTD